MELKQRLFKLFLKFLESNLLSLITLHWWTQNTHTCCIWIQKDRQGNAADGFYPRDKVPVSQHLIRLSFHIVQVKNEFITSSICIMQWLKDDWKC